MAHPDAQQIAPRGPHRRSADHDGPGPVLGPARRRARQGRAARRVPEDRQARPVLLRRGDGDRPAAHAGARRRGGLPRPRRDARPRHARPAAVGAERRVVPGRPRPGRPAARTPPTRAAPCAAPSRGSPELGYTPQIGPELEFFLLERDPASPGGVRRRVDRPSMVYTVGPQVDPGGFIRTLTEQLQRHGTRGLRGQPRVHEQPVRDQPAPRRGGRRRRPRVPPEGRGEGRRRDQRPRRDVHGQAVQRPGRQRPAPARLARQERVERVRRPGRRQRRSRPPCATSSAASCATRPALMAILNPTINAYRRLVPDSLAPTHANWGWDNRSAFGRVPPERGPATRLEIRVGDGSANPYLAIAVLLQAGLHGLRERDRPAGAGRRRRVPRRGRRRPAAPVPRGRRSTRSRPTSSSSTRSGRRSSRRSWR